MKGDAMFNIDESKVPEVRLMKSWLLANGEMNHLYQAGNWSFETDDFDLDYAEEAIYAWVAWYNYVKAQSK